MTRSSRKRPASHAPVARGGTADKADPDARAFLLELAGALLLVRGRARRDPDDLNDAVRSLGEAALLLDPEPVRRAKVRSNLAVALLERYEAGAPGDPADLDAAIEALVDVIPRIPRPEQPTALHNLGLAYRDRFDRFRRAADVDVAITSFRQSLDGVFGGIQAGHLNSLAGALRAKALAENRMDLLADAVAGWEEALAEPSLALAERAGYELNLANALLDAG